MLKSHKYVRQAQDFEKEYQNNTDSMIRRFLNIIANGIQANGGLIHFGNINLFTIGGVPYECTGFISYDDMTDEEKRRRVELYSDDGWNRLEDIANWADIVEDYLAAKAEGSAAMKERGYLPKDSVGYVAKPVETHFLSRDEILDFIRSMSMSQGYYGRLLNQIMEDSSILDTLEEERFKDTLSLVLYLEG